MTLLLRILAVVCLTVGWAVAVAGLVGAVTAIGLRRWQHHIETDMNQWTNTKERG